MISENFNLNSGDAWLSLKSTPSNLSLDISIQEGIYQDERIQFVIYEVHHLKSSNSIVKSKNVSEHAIEIESVAVKYIKYSNLRILSIQCNVPNYNL